MRCVWRTSSSGGWRRQASWSGQRRRTHQFRQLQPRLAATRADRSRRERRVASIDHDVCAEGDAKSTDSAGDHAAHKRLAVNLCADAHTLGRTKTRSGEQNRLRAHELQRGAGRGCPRGKGVRSTDEDECSEQDEDGVERAVGHRPMMPAVRELRSPPAEYRGGYLAVIEYAQYTGLYCCRYLAPPRGEAGIHEKGREG